MSCKECIWATNQPPAVGHRIFHTGPTPSINIPFNHQPNGETWCFRRAIETNRPYAKCDFIERQSSCPDFQKQ